MFTGKRTKIVCTMGPSCEDESTLRDLIRYGMNVARFNFSHGTHEYHKMIIERVRKVAAELGANVAIMLDTKGPEIRTGSLENHIRINLRTGDEIVVTNENVPGTKDRISIDYANLPNELKRGNVILIDDGLIELVVQSVEMNNIHCRIAVGGLLGEHKGVTLPNVHLNIPSVTERDRDDILFGIEMGIDCISASFIRNADGVKEIRDILEANGGEGISVFSKIESAIAVKNFDEILAVSSGIMVARGDLGVEVPPAEVPHLQKMMIRKCNAVYKPVITATQMLDSMIRNPRPTRAECTDVANAIYDGTDCIMLSGETAAGAFPVDAVHMMTSICLETERFLDEKKEYSPRGGVRDVNGSIGFSAAEIANRLNAKAIMCSTRSGRTARLISHFRPHEAVFAFSPEPRTLRKCCFYWGVDAYLVDDWDRLASTFDIAIDAAKERQLVAEGDLVVVTAGDPRTAPTDEDGYVSSTNVLMVSQIND